MIVGSQMNPRRTHFILKRNLNRGRRSGHGTTGVPGFDPGFAGVPVVCGCVRKSLVCVGGVWGQ